MSDKSAVMAALSVCRANRRRGILARVARSFVQRKLQQLVGGTIVVRDPWGSWEAGKDGDCVEITVSDPSFYSAVLFDGSLGAARSWFESGWDCDDLVRLLRLMVQNLCLLDGMDSGLATTGQALARSRHALRRNSRQGSARNIHAHYDLGNDFFATFLDKSMTYSCAVFDSESTSLERAQKLKLDRICKMLRLSPADDVVEIGSGWGSFAIHAAREYGCRVTTTTISKAQHELACRMVEEAGLSSKVTVLLSDYRELPACFPRRFDKLASIEMIEAVGHRYLPQFFETCSALLRDGGAMVLQAITMPGQRYKRYLRSSDFIQTHIFPGSCCPSANAILDAVVEASDFRLTHMADIGPHYSRTLAHWRSSLEVRWPTLRKEGYSEQFLRMWQYYFAYCEAGFAEHYTGTMQMLLEKPASFISCER